MNMKELIEIELELALSNIVIYEEYEDYGLTKEDILKVMSQEEVDNFNPSKLNIAEMADLLDEFNVLMLVLERLKLFFHFKKDILDIIYNN